MARNKATIIGLQAVERKLNAELQGIKVRSAKGLVRFAIRVRNETESRYPLSPRDTGILRASWINHLTWAGGTYSMLMGYTANYAKFVHAFKDNNTNWTGGGSREQWFTKTLKRNLPLLKTDITTK